MTSPKKEKKRRWGGPRSSGHTAFQLRPAEMRLPPRPAEGGSMSASGGRGTWQSQPASSQLPGPGPLNMKGLQLPLSQPERTHGSSSLPRVSHQMQTHPFCCHSAKTRAVVLKKRPPLGLFCGRRSSGSPPHSRLCCDSAPLLGRDPSQNYSWLPRRGTQASSPTEGRGSTSPTPARSPSQTIPSILKGCLGSSPKQPSLRVGEAKNGYRKGRR